MLKSNRYDPSLALWFECKAHFMPIGYVVIVAHAIILKWTYVERIIGAPIDYGLLALQ